MKDFAAIDFDLRHHYALADVEACAAIELRVFKSLWINRLNHEKCCY